MICCKERGLYTDADCWLAAENLMLAACDRRLGPGAAPNPAQRAEPRVLSWVRPGG